LEHAFAGMCSRRNDAAGAELSTFSLPIGESRRPDSNRGPLHYELSASTLRIPRFPCKCASGARTLSPWKSTEVHSAPAMCSNGVPIGRAGSASRSAAVRPILEGRGRRLQSGRGACRAPDSLSRRRDLAPVAAGSAWPTVVVRWESSRRGGGTHYTGGVERIGSSTLDRSVELSEPHEMASEAREVTPGVWHWCHDDRIDYVSDT